MCLTAISYEKSLVKKVYKILNHNKVKVHLTDNGYNINWYITPFRNTLYPLNGLLYPKSKKQFRKCRKYHDGYIHSYTERALRTKDQKIFTAYAINVLASGYNDCISRAIYIPELDLTRTNPEKKILCKSLMECKNNKDILKLLPELKNFI